MKKVSLILLFAVVCVATANAQLGKKINLSKAVDAASKGVQALTLSDAEISAYAQEYIDWIDAHNPVCSVDDSDEGMKAVAVRLDNIVKRLPITEVNGKAFDIKALYVVDVNAFACANGSIRVFAGLMSLMTDEQILAVIGHEIGHVANNDSKDAFKNALMTSALKDAVASTSNTVATLSDSQLGSLAEALSNSQYSQKQEYAADAYGYDLLKKTDADASNMASSLGVLLNLSEGTGSGSLSSRLFSSHPELQKRIDVLNKKN